MAPTIRLPYSVLVFVDGTYRLLQKEVLDILQKPMAVLSLFFLAASLVCAAGELVVERPPLRVFLYTKGVSEQEASAARAALAELTDIEVTESHTGTVRPYAVDSDGATFAIVHRGSQWQVFDRYPTLRQEEQANPIAVLIESFLNTQKQRNNEASMIIKAGKNISRMSAAPGDSRHQLVPQTIALIVVFLPFLLVAKSYSREIADGTLPILLVRPVGGWGKLVIVKIITSAWVVLVGLLGLVLLVNYFFGIVPKNGITAIILTQTLAIFVSACVGLSAAILLQNETQTYIALGVYILALILLTGFFFPLEAAAPIIQKLSHAVPLTYSSKLLERWFFYGVEPSWTSREVRNLMLQCPIAFSIVLIAIRVAQRKM